jgi:hypothetical protein
MSEPYCRLYIDTDDDRASVQAVIDTYLPRAFEGVVVDAPVFKNTGFEPGARVKHPYDPIECSPLTAEVGTIDERPDDVTPFQAGLVRLVAELRRRGYFVTASCDFEERVTEETGWNWSTKSTEPPGRTRG